MFPIGSRYSTLHTLREVSLTAQWIVRLPLRPLCHSAVAAAADRWQCSGAPEGGAHAAGARPRGGPPRARVGGPPAAAARALGHDLAADHPAHQGRGARAQDLGAGRRRGAAGEGVHQEPAVSGPREDGEGAPFMIVMDSVS